MKYTMDRIRQMVAEKVRGNKPSDGGMGPWVRELTPESNTTGLAVVDEAGELTQRSYSIVDGEVTLGDPTKVEQVYQPISEAARMEMLVEVGRVLSSSNEGILRKAMDMLASVLAALGPDPAAEQVPGQPVPGQPVPAPAAPQAIPKLVKKMFESREQEFVGDAIPLVEKAVRDNGTVPVKIISPGWGSSGYYSADVLKRDGPKAFPKGSHMHWDHPTKTEEAERPERSLTTIAAVLAGDTVYMEEGPSGPGLYNDAAVRKAYRESVDELAPHIGTSIRTLGIAKVGEAEGRRGRIIEKILPATPEHPATVDFVTTPGRGGEILSLFEAARGRALSAPLDESEVELIEGSKQEEDVSQEELEEARRQLAEAQRERDEAKANAARDHDALLLREASDFVQDELSGIKMADFVRARLAESLSGNPPVKDGALDKDTFKARIAEAIKVEAAYLAKATGRDGEVRGMGDGGGSTDVLGLSESGGGQGFGVTEANADAKLVEAFKVLGMSDEAAKTAAAGRAN